jgi:aspartyl protease family protein
VSGQGGDQALNFLYLVGVLVLVASSFAVRRIPMGQGLKMFAAWMLIFVAAFAVFALKDDFMALGKRMFAEGTGSARVVETGQELRIHKSDDGHFWVDASLNGKTMHFLVDSGATVTSISKGDADRAGIEPSGAFPVMVDTANGVVGVWRGRADSIKLGSIERRDFAVHIGEDDTNVLGMNFLSSLTSWGVQGEWLVLKP